MAITSIMNATPAAAKAFIDNLGFTGITTAVSSSGTNVSHIKHNNELVLGGLKVYYNDGSSSFDLGSSSSAGYIADCRHSGGSVFYTHQAL